MRAADAMHDRLRFDRDTGAKDDGTGQHVATGAVVCTRYCHVAQGMTSKHYRLLHERYNAVQVVLELRYDEVAAGLGPQDTGVSLVSGKLYDLLGPPLDVDGRRRDLVIAATERFPVIARTS